MKFTLTYNVEDHGWAEAKLQSDGENYKIDSISYLSDAFAELSQAVLELLNGAKEAGCGFDHEPGRTKLRFTSSDEDVLIRVYEFENELVDKPWNKGKCVKRFQVRILRLKSQYLKAADRILEKYSTKEYQQRWSYPFPMDTYNSVKAAKFMANGTHESR